MSDFLQHECGIAVIRLKKSLAYYQDHYGTSLWGFHKLFLLMEKQYNRGQDGAGIGCVKLDVPFGKSYLNRRREAGADGLGKLFRKEMEFINELQDKGKLDSKNPQDLKEKFDFAGEVLIGHLRYGTSGAFNEFLCHPYLRRSNWVTRSLMLAGNFNMTNVRELNDKLVKRGQHPVFSTDAQTVLEEIGFHLDEMHTDIYRQARLEGIEGKLIPERIAKEMDIAEVVRQSSENWDGGYVIVGAVGNGNLFVVRDPKGIRPCYFLETEDFIAFASERVALMTVFDASIDEVKELEAGVVSVVDQNAICKKHRIFPKQESQSCSFERIYFSRGNDPEIYQERKKMGAMLVPQILKAINNDLEKAVFSFIPNTAEIAYGGMVEELERIARTRLKTNLLDLIEKGEMNSEKIDTLFSQNFPRREKIAYKDIKLRTFISQEQARNHLASYIYDVTCGIVCPDDSLVVVDDSIVRGTTLKTSILEILARTNPKKIVICSTAPQIRYPDCYGIDMSEIAKFVAFQAALNLRKKRNEQVLLEEIYQNCLKQVSKTKGEIKNAVSALYEDLSQEEISAEIAKILYPNSSWKGELVIIYQTIENLHSSLNGNYGDWYFTGKYPTKGGMHLVNRAYIHWYKGIQGRSYDLPF